MHPELPLEHGKVATARDMTSGADAGSLPLEHGKVATTMRTTIIKRLTELPLEHGKVATPRLRGYNFINEVTA